VEDQSATHRRHSQPSAMLSSPSAGHHGTQVAWS